MNSNWETFLTARGAEIDTDGMVRFSGMPVEAECALCALGDFSLLTITGEDAPDFLQGQVSNDLRELTNGHSQLSAHCNAKGRMLANFRVFAVDHGFALIVPRDLSAALVKRLKMFVLRAKVEVADLSNERVCIGLVGDCLASAALEHFPSLPKEPGAVSRAGDDTIINVPGPLPRWLFVGSVATAKILWNRACADGAREAGSALWALNDIRAGIPLIRAATSERFVPQMTNLHLIDGVSFHKGCYTGQEVVARMQYLGKLKRRMYFAEVALSQAPAPGSALISPGSRSDKDAGTVVDARINAQGQCELLAVAEIAAVERGDLSLPDLEGALALQAPPYGFPAEV